MFFGRKNSFSRLTRRLTPSKIDKDSYKGAYLVTGYRSMGKTTMVNKVINEISENHKILKVEVTLSQGNLNYESILKQIFVQFSSCTMEYRNSTVWVSIFRGLSSVVSLLCTLVLFSVISDKYLLSNLTSLFVIAILFITLYSLIYLVVGKLRYNLCTKHNDVFFNKVDDLHRRIFSSLEISSNSEKASGFTGLFPGSAIFNQSVETINNSGINPSKQLFNEVSSKELEFIIKDILKSYDSFRANKKNKYGRVIFVIDELDKIEPEFDNKGLGYSSSRKSRAESRKGSLSKVLANLKSFINTADAKFVFIGGVDMYEANLADIADRESFYSSIFQEVIYLDSFFKDYENPNDNNIYGLVENYLCSAINGTNIRFAKKDIRLKDVFSDQNFIGDSNSLYDTLRGFIIYLTYRSNGSPKKLRQLIEHYVVQLSQIEIVNASSVSDIFSRQEIGRAVSKTNRYEDISSRYQGFMKSKSILSKLERDKSVFTFIKISSDQKYKIGLLCSMYENYLHDNNLHLKRLNDRNLYLSAFLIDHLLKFHKSAFSWKHIELMPDIILGNRGPNLRDNINQILDFLSKNHIRRTMNSMFKYKFRRRIDLELSYISQVSDESAAAYNFTYDESYHLKSYFKNKLKQKQEDYSKSIDGEKGKFVHTIAYLNSTIADIHFYDEEYDSAIRYYADAVQALRSTVQKNERLTNHQFVLFVRNRLLLSLCLEKSGRYDSSYSIIRNIILQSNSWDSKKNMSDGSLDTKATWEKPYNRMQLFLRPHIALLAVIEKDRSDGITFYNLQRNVEEYCKFLRLKNLFPSQEFKPDFGYKTLMDEEGIKADFKRIQTLLADYYQNVGSILFLKNRNFKELYEYGTHGVLYTLIEVDDKGIIGTVGQKEYTIDESVYGSDDIPKYISLNCVRSTYDGLLAKTGIISTRDHYYPSFSAYFYYRISLGHLLEPYRGNLKSISKVEPKKLYGTLSMLLKNYTSHVLNGDQKQLIGLILSKLSDATLSSVGVVDNFFNDIGVANKETLFKNDFWGISNDDKILFTELFSIKNAVYLNILSYRFYKKSGNYYDAKFQLMKCMYIVKSHLVVYNDNVNNSPAFDTMKSFIDVLQNLINEMWEKSGGVNLHRNKMKLTIHELELKLLRSRILDEKLSDQFFTINTGVENIYNRMQVMKFEITQLTKETNIGVILNSDGVTSSPIISADYVSRLNKVYWMYNESLRALKSMDVNYIVGHSFIAEFHRNMSFWLMSNIKILKLSTSYPKLALDIRDWEKINLSPGESMDSRLLMAIESYERTIRMHSEGPEYARYINKIYVLEDDFNDSHVHFFAALERSLINTGFVESKMNELIEIRAL